MVPFGSLNIYIFTLIYLFLLYNTHFQYVFLEYFFLCLSCARVILPMCHNYIYVFVNVFLHIISMFAARYLRTLYYLLLGHTSYWEACHNCFFYISYSFNLSPSSLTCAHSNLITTLIYLLYSWCMHLNTYYFLIYIYFVYLLLLQSFLLFINIRLDLHFSYSTF